jgi:MYXO-CTERM domain-containing protein
VRTKGEEHAYLCLAADEEADTALLQALAADADTKSGSHRRMQRALAIHVMQRLDQPADVVALRALNAADRRLLRDAVHARRGRKSPVPEHAAVFEKFDWYQPNRRFTNRSLTALDQENLVIIDKPPRAPKPEADAPAIEAVPTVPAHSPEAAPASEGCGCTSVAAASGWAWLLGVGALTARRRGTDPQRSGKKRSGPPTTS